MIVKSTLRVGEIRLRRVKSGLRPGEIFAIAKVSGPAVGIIWRFTHSENKRRERADGSEMFRFCGSAPFQRNGCNSVKCGHLWAVWLYFPLYKNQKTKIRRNDEALTMRLPLSHAPARRAKECAAAGGRWRHTDKVKKHRVSRPLQGSETTMFLRELP